MPTDAELLRRYAKEKAEDAFAALVRRHLNLVYAAALRRTNGRHALAEEISQRVFTDLARKAAQLTSHPTLTGWLYRSTRFAAIDAIRIEQRREKLAQVLTTMPDELLPAQLSTNWEQLRPVIDAAMDELKEPDREVMLLRFFQGLTFAEVGEKLSLSENTARMRTERALERLRLQLGKRGITSSAALAGLLAGQSLVAAPASLAATITTTALSAGAAGGVSIFTSVLMNKLTVTTASAVLAAGLTSFAWVAVANDNSTEKLNALRAENARLTQATTPGAQVTAETVIADEFSGQATTIVQSVEQRLAQKTSSGIGGHQYRGQATPHDAFMSYAWAESGGEVGALAKLITFDAKGRDSILAIHASMPDAIRAQYRTPEELIAFFLIADAMLTPGPGADVIEPYIAAELRPGRAAMRPPGRNGGGMEFQLTADGWKNEVPSHYPRVLASRVLGSEMLAKLSLH